MFRGDNSTNLRDGAAVSHVARRGTRTARRVVVGMALALMMTPAATGGVHGDVPEKIFVYSVNHPTHGEVGTYRNNIIDTGEQISVRNEIKVKVKVLLVVAHDETTQSKEIWKEGRLISFSGVTRENGKETSVKGEAEGSKFIVEAPSGSKVAPASVYPNNPWTKSILNATVLFGTKSGNLYKVHANPGEVREVVLGDRKVQTEYFRVQGDAQYELWFDKRGVPVKFTEDAEHGKIIFNLIEETVQPASALAKPAKDNG